MSKGHRDPTTGLTQAQERFALELVKPGTTQADAYRLAFPHAKKWKDDSVWVKASQLAASAKVRQRVTDLRQQITTAGVMDANETLLILSRVARADLRKCFNGDGTIKAPHEIDDDTAFGLLALETFEEFEGKGGDRKLVGYSRKVRIINRVEALRELVKHHGLLEKDNAQKVDPIASLLESIANNQKLVGPGGMKRGEGS